MIGVDGFFHCQIDSLDEHGMPVNLHLVSVQGCERSAVESLLTADHVRSGVFNCIRDGTTQVINHIDRGTDSAMSGLAAMGARSYAAFPLLAEGKSRGAFCLINRKKDTFTADEVELMQSIALQVASVQDRISRNATIKQSDESLRLASMVARLAVSRIDYHANLVHLDSLAASLYGLGNTPVTLTREKWHDTFHPDDRKIFDQHLTETIAKGNDGWIALEHRVILPDGSMRWLNIRKQIYFQNVDTKRLPTHAIIAAHDITNERLSAEELKQAEMRLRTMYETSMMGILQFDSSGNVIDANDAFLKMIGWTREEFLKNPVKGDEITPPGQMPSRQHLMEEFRKTGKILPFEKEYIHRDGKHVPALVSATALDSKWNNGVAFIVDLSHIKRVERELRHLTENLERRVMERTAEVNERNKQLRGLALDLAETEARERKRLAQILHDHFQQLISAAKLKVGIVRRKVGDSNLIESFHQIESLLDEAITESRSLATELSPPVLHDAGLQAGFEWLARKMKRDHNLEVTMLIEAGSEPDNERVRLVLFDCVREMLFNVVKHAGVKQAEIIMRIRVEGLLSIMVRDNGKGFDPNLDLTQHSPDGSFGLFSIRERLSMLGGLLDIRSMDGKGTELEITVPASTKRESAEYECPTIPEKANNTNHALKVVNVMVADDHKMFREGLIALISQESYVRIVAEAGDGAEAVELARQTNPDILICDVTMPKLNGIEVTSILSREKPQIRIIGLSMHERDDMAQAMKQAGAVAYCTKGGPTDTLLGVLKSVASEAVQNGHAHQGIPENISNRSLLM